VLSRLLTDAFHNFIRVPKAVERGVEP